jgi:hypothetical protein
MLLAVRMCNGAPDIDMEFYGELAKRQKGGGMSGGHFDYEQCMVGYLADDIDCLIESGEYSDEVLINFRAAVDWLRQAELAVQRIDYLVSGDDGEEAFLKRWNDEVLGGGQ